MKTNYLSKEETWAENYSIYKINCKIFCKGIQNQKLKNQPTNQPALTQLKTKLFFFCLRRFYWRPRFSTPEILLILLYFSLQHPLRT